ncbi:hypothetical protein HKCCE4037_16445 [Rhodobacterales bacterium HKCCE4037]|nr:hypothetical protein [Rhodobacterales bacterium HKCCE4037]
MPIEYCTSLELDLLYARWFGRVDFEQFELNFARYLNDAHYRAGRPELIDHSGIVHFDINFSLVQSILRQVNAQVPEILVETHTVLYSPNETIFGIGRMYQSLAEIAGGIRVEIFQTEREALDALQLPHESIAHLLEAETFHPPTPAGPDA